MKFWALMSLLALCQARPDKLPVGPPQGYSAPNPIPSPAPAPIFPPVDTYSPPQPQLPIQVDPIPSVQQPQLVLEPTSPVVGQGQSPAFPAPPQQLYQTPLNPGPGPVPQPPAPGPTTQAPAPGPVNCPEGQVDRGDGTCATPQITRNLFLYRVPDEAIENGNTAVLPDPKVHYNFVFIRTAEQGADQLPLVAPAPQQKTLVYVLNKKQEVHDQKVIQQDSKPTQPEVYFVSYKDGDNLDLPGGVDLQTALSQSLLKGEVVENPGDILVPSNDKTIAGPIGYSYSGP